MAKKSIRSVGKSEAMPLKALQRLIDLATNVSFAFNSASVEHIREDAKELYNDLRDLLERDLRSKVKKHFESKPDPVLQQQIEDRINHAFKLNQCHYKFVTQLKVLDDRLRQTGRGDYNQLMSVLLILKGQVLKLK